MYDAVIFDSDGVLVSRTAYDVLHGAAWAAFDAVGVSDPEQVAVESTVIDVSPEDISAICEQYDLDPETFWSHRERLSTERQRAEALAGRKTPYEDISALDRLSVPLAIVSSNQQATVDFLLEQFGLGSYFDIALGRQPTLDSLDKQKPNPHYLNQAVAALDADSVLFVGDNDSDIQAADNAGVDSAFIRRPHRRHHDPTPEPTYVVEDLHDIVSLCRSAMA